MLALFRKNDITALLGLCLLTLFCKLHILLHPPALSELDAFHQATVYTFTGWKSFYNSNPFLFGLLSTVVLVFMALYINYVSVREKMFLRKSYLPAVAFILFTSLVPSHSFLGTPMIASFLCWVALGKSIGLAQQAKPKKDIFHIGFLAALAMLFYFPSVIFFLLLLLLIVFFRPLALQELTAYILGYLTPIYLTGIIAYITGHWNSLLRHIYTHIMLPTKIIHPKQTILVGIISICVLVYGWFEYQQQQNRLHISIRKKWNALGMYFVAAAVAGLFSSLFPGQPWVFLAPPFSILLSQALQSRKEKLNIFTFYFVLLALLLMQWVIK
ncbi:MAG: hypothetical protein JNM95_15735 [Chitinophagaceae bacterium]|nr:hypothetical protein [Chitinophagaceae bacterium]